ncbi:hypothetical protein CFP65_6939 [Kitasatospora sp. MMS16-BH015]|uniref:hypothetical protein n=1 Tax=Kitasatospora sp. MMS16-BH015 TaxID=2018025 RepID=UPI000CA14FC8|nr:hypothetical protein [Kitasatospora sp. MMS16-BH015]AUG81556.1 hypothetical protein CFP65_6939 [Kitasatospora sp. MMS16-BH015]
MQDRAERPARRSRRFGTVVAATLLMLCTSQFIDRADDAGPVTAAQPVATSYALTAAAGGPSSSDSHRSVPSAVAMAEDPPRLLFVALGGVASIAAGVILAAEQQGRRHR